jgi:hypothetical protein
VDQNRVAAAKALQGMRELVRDVGVPNTDQLVLRARWVRQWP